MQRPPAGRSARGLKRALLPWLVASLLASVLGAGVMRGTLIANAANAHATLEAAYVDATQSVHVKGSQFPPKSPVKLEFLFGSNIQSANANTNADGTFQFDEPITPSFSGNLTIRATAHRQYVVQTPQSATTSPPSVDSTPAHAPPPANSNVPAIAAAAGFTKPLLVDNFDNTSTIDMTNSCKPGFNWYLKRPWSWGVYPTNELQVKDGYLRLTQSDGDANWGIATNCPTDQTAKGFKFGYFEARMRFTDKPTPSPLQLAFPAFWSMSADHITNRYNGRTSEIDFFEAYRPANGEWDHHFAGTVHDWTEGNENPPGSIGNNTSPMTGVDTNQWHTYATLWQPGEISWYLDGKRIITQKYGANIAPSPNPNNLPVGTFSYFDTQPNGNTVILGTGGGWALDVDSVGVYGR